MPSATARGRRLAHQERGRSPAPQCIVDEAGDRRPVARAGEAMGKPPVLQRIRRRPAARLDIGQHIDGGGEAGGGRHQTPRRTRTMKIAHITISTVAPEMKIKPRLRTSLSVTWI